MKKSIVPPRGDLEAAMCPSRTVLDHVTSRWGVLVLMVLLEGTHRFGELRKRIGGVSEKMLAQTLRLLEEDGIVRREAYPEVPPRVEYALTPLGHGVAQRVTALAEWVETHVGDVLTERAKHGRGLPPSGRAPHSRS